MLRTEREIANALHALVDATGIDDADVATVAQLDPAMVRAALDLFVASVLVIVEGQTDAEVQARIGALLLRLDAIRAGARGACHAA